LLKEWVEEVRRTKHGYTILMGDSLDSARTHYRNHVASYREDENSQEALDELQRGVVRELAEILKPIKHKIMGCIRGNHYWEFSDKTNSEQLLCKLLGIKYLGVLGGVRVVTPAGKKLAVFAHHSGGGGGMTVGGDANSMVKQEAAWDVDVYLMGHTHKRIAFKLPTMRLTDEEHPQIVERTKVFVRCGAFLKGFKIDNPTVDRPHAPGYAEVRAYRPTDLGWVRVDVGWQANGLPEFGVAY
jgi:predicted phosphodiesterase